MKNYEEFKKAIIEGMKAELPDEYEGYTYSFETIRKSDREYESLIIRNPNDRMTVTPTLDITSAYESYQEGASMSYIIGKFVDIRTNASLTSEFDPRSLLMYEKIKDRVIPRLVNTQFNRDYISDKVRYNIEDLTVIYSVIIKEDKNGVAAAMVTDELMKSWGIDQATLDRDAMDNLRRNTPYFANIESVLFDKNNFVEIDEIDPDDYRAPFFVLTNTNKHKGAVQVLNNEYMQKIYDLLGRFYIIPSSVDEVLIAPFYAVDGVAELRNMVAQVNDSEVSPEDRLSYNVYTWTKEDGFKMA